MGPDENFPASDSPTVEAGAATTSSHPVAEQPPGSGKGPRVLLLAGAVIAGLVLVAAAAFAGSAIYDEAHDTETVTVQVDRSIDPHGLDGAEVSRPTTRRDLVDVEGSLSADEVKRASEAALAIVGGGRVVEVDRSDDLGEAYEVEVVVGDREVDVALDKKFRRVPNLRYDR